MAKFSALLLSIVIGTETYARERFEFKLGDKVQVLSDKAYRSSTKDKFEAVGNVIITYGKDALYGERAQLSFKESKVQVSGNVRYIGSDMTMYGSKIDYNFASEVVDVYNARVLSDNYTVLGKKISKINDNTIIATDAEYTTCKDCPESWSILGADVEITVGEYVRIQGAYIKVNGVIVMYVPYVVLPIKKDRETGLLFPELAFGYQNGVLFQQPFFWAISDQNDLTFSPTLYGQRGVGSEVQYRHVFGEKNWFEFNGLGAFDRIWRPGKTTEERENNYKLRSFSEYEHNFMPNNDFSHHLYMNQGSDLDMIRDYDRFAKDKIQGSETGIEGHFEIRKDYFTTSVEASYNRNLLVDDAKEFDGSYVQILPRVKVETVPMEVFESDIPLLKRMLFTFKGDGTIFKQDRVEESDYIRNAIRANLRPKVDWYLGQFGVFNLKTEATYDYQGYYFPEEEDAKRFRKSAVLVESELSFEVEKIFGVAYERTVPSKNIDFSKSKIERPNKARSVDEKLIGEIPDYLSTLDQENFKVVNNSYKHSQVWKLKHYQLADESNTGNAKFENQIRAENGVGRFDTVDAFRREEFQDSQSKTDIPLQNTIEFQWNNSLIKKSARTFNPYKNNKYLRDNFSYSKTAYFNISQGLDLSIDQDDDTFLNRLTRFYVATGFSLGNFSFSASEYYFHKEEEHIFNLTASQRFDLLDYSLTFNYDSFARPINKLIKTDISFRPFDVLRFNFQYDYNLATSLLEKSRYAALIAPTNNCWMFDIAYEVDQIESKVAFNIYFNFNENNFQGIDF